MVIIIIHHLYFSINVYNLYKSHCAWITLSQSFFDSPFQNYIPCATNWWKTRFKSEFKTIPAYDNFLRYCPSQIIQTCCNKKLQINVSLIKLYLPTKILMPLSQGIYFITSQSNVKFFPISEIRLFIYSRIHILQLLQIFNV